MTVAVDTMTGKIWFAKNNVYQAGGNPVAGTNPGLTFTPGTAVYPFFTSYSAATAAIPVAPPYPDPTGFIRL